MFSQVRGESLHFKGFEHHRTMLWSYNVPLLQLVGFVLAIYKAWALKHRQLRLFNKLYSFYHFVSCFLFFSPSDRMIDDRMIARPNAVKHKFWIPDKTYMFKRDPVFGVRSTIILLFVKFTICYCCSVLAV